MKAMLSIQDAKTAKMAMQARNRQGGCPAFQPGRWELPGIPKSATRPLTRLIYAHFSIQ